MGQYNDTIGMYEVFYKIMFMQHYDYVGDASRLDNLLLKLNFFAKHPPFDVCLSFRELYTERICLHTIICHISAASYKMTCQQYIQALGPDGK